MLRKPHAGASFAKTFSKNNVRQNIILQKLMLSLDGVCENMYGLATTAGREGTVALTKIYAHRCQIFANAMPYSPTNAVNIRKCPLIVQALAKEKTPIWTDHS
jgi:hypothetical protein